ncbi:ectonucleotide pyrophosphatase/phosphodiesterase family member 3 [Turdus rufiventris]|nr:ectonucleotide pyrophosphatase/phosphodiesterase family member 3 [Turdus rufiventris]
MELEDDITRDHRGYSEEMALKSEEYVKKKTVFKYKVICAVLLCALVVVSLGLGLGLGLNRGKQEQVSCRHKCNEPREEGVPGCQCDSGCRERQDCCWDYEDTCVEPTRSWKCTNFRCGETRIPGSYCSCSDDCLQKKDCCVNYYSICKGETSWVEEPCVSIETPQCPAGFTLPPLILFSMDGFRAEYLETWSSLLPNIGKFKTCGTHSKYMRAVYPTKTFPNHYTIVTGLYPESHGIIDNNMYDVDLNAHFSLSGEEKFKPAWWKGQPVWLTAMYQNLKAGTFFWPGSDVPIEGTYPTLYNIYNGSVPYEERISGILKWLDNAQPERPDIYTLYIEEPDSSGHSFGPVSAGVIKALQAADQALGMLMDGLKQRNLHKCVNLIVVADHGMEKTYCSQLEYMTNYFKEVNFCIYAGPAARIRAWNVPEDYFTFDSKGIVQNLTCRRSPQHFKPYLTPDLPKRFHYANNRRIDKVHLLVDRQWLAVRDENYTFCDGGNHGYNNEFKSMEAIFLAYGPSFKDKTEVDAFENIEVYNLMCDLLRISPAENNGTHGSLNHLLKKPFYNPSHPNEVSSPSSCPVFTLIPANDLGCKCMQISNETEMSLNERLNLTTEENYNSSDLEQYDALLTSNIVPMYKAFKEIWDYFHDVLLQKYARERNGVNVISGPVFDYNYDGHFDSPDEIEQYVNNTKIPVPTHYYVILTSCKNTSYTPLNCSGSLDVASFIIPHRPDNTESCAENKTLSEWVEERVQAHSARVRDVELLTGLDFYQERNESVSEILRLKTFLPIFNAESN